MDIITLLMILSLFLIIFLVGILKTNYKKNQRGKKGEKIVANSLRFWVEKKNKNYVYNDLTLPTLSGDTTQIDHLVLSVKGIFVIETKYLNGKILGDVDKQHWIHTNHLKQDNQIYNPLMQNNGHIKHLAQILKVPMSEMTGIVTNVGNAKLSGSINPLFGKAAIERGTGFAFKIWCITYRAFTQERVDQLKNLIDSIRLDQSDEVNKKHIGYVKRLNSKNTKTSAVIIIACFFIICLVILTYILA